MRLFVLACCAVAVLGACYPRRAIAQQPEYETIYRPPSVSYRVLTTPHFDIIFEEGLDQEARETAAALERTLPGTKQLMRVRRPVRMPVVLNGFNDRANGYVTPFPFKQEIEASAIKGNGLTPRYPSWIEQVSTHELAHAVHAEYDRGFGVGRVLRWFSPDLARVLNFSAPAGITEGIAVYRESRIYPHAGRLNLGLVDMELRAAMLSDEPWSLSQMLESPFYTWPFNRYYTGGARFMEYLADRDSLQSFRRATGFYYRFPFLGYGTALWYGARTWPFRLGSEFRESVRERMTLRMDTLGSFAEPHVLAGERGEAYRRPRWLDGRTLVVYAEGYDLTPGFYRIDVETGERSAIGHHRITEDYFFSLGRDSASVLFSRYVANPLVPIKDVAEAFRLDLDTGDAERLTQDGRVFAAMPGPEGSIRAFQNDGQFTRRVEIKEGAVAPLPGPRRADYKVLLPSPDDRMVAALVNAGGYQGLFRVFQEGHSTRLKPWLLFEEAVIYDADWSHDSRFLLFSADLGGIPNAYAYDVQADRILRLTNTPFGALEPSLSPDGKTLAFVSYRHERYDLVTQPFKPDAAEVVPRSLALAGRDLDWEAVLSEAPETGFETAGTSPYHPGRYLRPRLLYPVIDLEDAYGTSNALGVKVGAGIQGADPLQRLAYGVEAYYQRERVWGEAAFEYGRFFLRPSLGIYSRPLRGSGGNLYQDAGVSLGLKTPVILESNVFSTFALTDLQVRYRDLNLVERAGTLPSGSGTRLTLSPSLFFAHRRQQNVRDLIPNSGLAVRADADADVWSRNLGMETRTLTARASLYVPLLKAINHGIRLEGGVLTKNGTALYDPGTFMPRGYEDKELNGHTFVRYGIEYVAPLRFVENGLIVLPVYVGAVYAYAVAEQLRPLGTARLLDPVNVSSEAMDHASSIGGGLGLHFRLFFNVDLDVRLGAAYRVEEKDWSLTGR